MHENQTPYDRLLADVAKAVEELVRQRDEQLVEAIDRLAQERERERLNRRIRERARVLWGMGVVGVLSLVLMSSQWWAGEGGVYATTIGTGLATGLVVTLLSISDREIDRHIEPFRFLLPWRG